MFEMSLEDLKKRLTEDDIRTLLVEHMNATIKYEDDNLWISNTVCHHGKSNKLYYYKDSKSFHCYTECGQMDIISLVIKHNSFDDEDDYIRKAISWICSKLNISTCMKGFVNTKKVNKLPDFEFINYYKKKITNRNSYCFEDYVQLPTYDKKILNMFTNKYTEDWYNDNISTETMMKYNIKYCDSQSKIIIPHYDINNNLIGIRNRCLLDEDVELFGKYSPFRTYAKMYNHPWEKFIWLEY